MKLKITLIVTDNEMAPDSVSIELGRKAWKDLMLDLCSDYDFEFHSIEVEEVKE